jgi:hypothetical protein
MCTRMRASPLAFLLYPSRVRGADGVTQSTALDRPVYAMPSWIGANVADSHVEATEVRGRARRTMFTSSSAFLRWA